MVNLKNMLLFQMGGLLYKVGRELFSHPVSNAAEQAWLEAYL